MDQKGARQRPFSFVALARLTFHPTLSASGLPQQQQQAAPDLWGLSMIESTSNVVAFRKRGAKPAPARHPKGLIEAVYAEADRQDITNVYWMTHETNEAGRRLYDRVARRTGFIKYER